MTVSLHILSDVHLEFEEYCPSVETDIVILAGDIHTNSISWLTRKLFDEPFDGKTVVVSHHGPSLACKHMIFGHSDFAGAFYSNLPDLMAKTDLWIYGHTHSNLDVGVNNSRLISNQKGYPKEKISGFDENLKIFL